MKQKTEHSRLLFKCATDILPGGVNSPVRACRNVSADPLFIERGAGSHIIDVDGNDYIDFVLSWGPMILGHAAESVTKAIVSAAEKGTSYGAPSPGEVNLALAVIDAVPTLQMVRMVNSGTEATMSAVRLARAVTGRGKIAKCIGCYHGHADPFLAAAGSGVATHSLPDSPGVPASVVADTLLVPYNDSEALARCFAENGNKIAAFIVEPVACNMGLVLPKPGYLERVRKLCTEYGILLIFDEVITGFRLGMGGAQERFGIEPDLSTFGKIIGGGLPVGAFGGKKDFMRLIAPEGSVYQAGTLSGNPLAMAAGLATLTELKKANYSDLETRTAHFAAELEKTLRKKNVPVHVPTIASMFSVFFTKEPVTDFTGAKTADQKLFTVFYHQMREQGIYLAPSSFETGMLSFAHTDEDLEKTLSAASRVSF